MSPRSGGTDPAGDMPLEEVLRKSRREEGVREHVRAPEHVRVPPSATHRCGSQGSLHSLPGEAPPQVLLLPGAM